MSKIFMLINLQHNMTIKNLTIYKRFDFTLNHPQCVTEIKTYIK